ncbi:MAG: hypothetical protein JJ926_03975 [Roseitalea sp.]|nr:hypothetical protein [Roseitalea sp.]MBO6951015.1 hypothetical protein [Rhizobiaceae bacterium]MBO6590998.1 hypothetical protein [Roseitalea sp.]MBO6599744.1 hypothetical protein [Roseitalea sp.]MBO6611500.1 hypothetical protein [Roseitalea sp.]
MIVYNVDRRFFPLKGEAIAYCVEHGHKRASIHKFAITNRDELAAFLDGLCEPAPDRPSPLPDVTVEREVPDCVPAFLRKSWGVE